MNIPRNQKKDSLFNSLPSLFLSQSLQDAWEDYTRALTRETFPCWDYIILTASNDHQAEGFRKQLTQRQASGALPPRTAFHVIPDPEGKRVGSGGATLNVLRFLARESGTEDFKSLRILVIHSGGDSRRVPQYSALGKLFSPVPRLLPDGRPSTLFDEFLIAMSGVPGRIREGMLLLSGDVLLLFNPLQIDFAGEGAAALSFKADAETGRNHGVYLRGEDDNVVEFLHKQTVETLQARGAVNSRGCVDIDTGAVLFSSGILQALYGLVKTEPERFINEKVRLSLYGDFQYPMASGSTLEKFFLEKPEGEFCPELEEARKAVWEALHPFRMKLLRLSPAKFIHFGTTHEILSLMAAGVEDYTGLGWARSISSSIKEGAAAGYMSVLSSGAECGEGVYLEVSSVGPGSRVGSRSILSFVDISGETIPEDVVLHALKRRDGKFVARIYGTGDNPKAGRGGTFLGGSLDGFMRENGLTESDLWDSREHTLWRARLYPACSNIREAVKAALNVYAMACGQGDTAAWRAGERTSLQAGFQDADPDALIAWEKRMGELVQMDALEKLIFAGRPVSDARGLLPGGKLTAIQREWMEGRLAQAGYGERMRLNYYVGKTLGGAEGERYIGQCFQAIQESVLGPVPVQQEKEALPNTPVRQGKEALLNSGLLQRETEALPSAHVQHEEGIQQRITQKECIVKLPLRLNWGGGWSDTPPYCYENGGTVLNAAVLLRGERPVTVRLTALEEKKVILSSADMGVYGEFCSIEGLQSVGDPYDPYVLQKAALIACGIIPERGGDLEAVLTGMGGGFQMDTEVVGVPKGSGLGTSSILAAACVKALYAFTGIPCTEPEIYSRVLAMEQIMSTGGGWQDQVGGLTSGIKFITTMPGVVQDIHIEPVRMPAECLKELNSRLILIYTGQRRLARNLLRDVVGRYIGNESENVAALNEIQRLAALMRFELERGHIDDFAHLLSEHWELSKKIDAGSSNTLIEQIFSAVDDLIEGRMICGAGGGGFLQVIMKNGVIRDEVRERLWDVFQDAGIDVWDCDLI